MYEAYKSERDIMLDYSDGYGGDYYHIMYKSGFFIATQGLGGLPQAIEWDDRIILGFDMSLLVISTDIEIKLVHRLSSIFYDFIPYSDNSIIIICETDIYAFTSSFVHLWRQNVDIITDYVINGNGLIFADYDGEIYSICVESGELVHIKSNR
jgi:hypothetical protein